MAREARLFLRLYICSLYQVYIIEGRGATAGTPAPATGFCNGTYANHHQPLTGPLAQHFGGISMYTLHRSGTGRQGMHRHKFQPFVSAPGQRCYSFVVYMSYHFVVHMYCSQGTEGNGQRAGVGDRTCTGTYSNHPRPVSGAPTPHTCCKTIGACRAPPLTYYGIPGTWYLVPGRQHRPISSCFSDTRRAYHVPACTSLLPDTVDGATSWLSLIHI